MAKTPLFLKREHRPHGRASRVQHIGSVAALSSVSTLELIEAGLFFAQNLSMT